MYSSGEEIKILNCRETKMKYLKAIPICICIMLIAIPSLSILSVNANTTDGVIASYDFIEGSGTLLSDSSGFGNDGTISGAVWETGISYSALLFDGTNDYVTCGTTLTGSVLTSFTVQAWIRPEVSTGPKYIFYDGSDGEYALSQSGTSCSITAKINGVNEKWTTAEKSIEFNKWQLVTGVFTGSELRISVNGVQRNSTTVPANGLYNPGGNYYPTIGSYEDASSNHLFQFKGAISGVKVWNHVLTPSEISYEYSSSSQNYPILNNSKIAYWPFNEGSGQTAFDMTMNGNNGRLGSTTTTDSSDPSWVDGISGKALKFDGINDYVDCGDSLAGTILNAFTIEAWVKPYSLSEETFIFYDGGDGEIFFNCVDYANVSIGIKNSNNQFYWTRGNLPLNEWSYVVGTYNRISLKLYINGELVSSLAVPDVSMVSLSGAYSPTIGAYCDISDNSQRAFFDGLIDELSVWQIALTPEEIKSQYRLYFEPPSLKAILKIDEIFLNLGDTTILDGSESNGPDLSDYYYDFGDGNNSGWTQSHSISHSYNSPGIFNASLIVRNISGNQSLKSAVKIYVGTQSQFFGNDTQPITLWSTNSSQTHPDTECVVYDVAVSNNGTYSAYCVVNGYDDATDYRGVRCYNKGGSLAWDISKPNDTPNEIEMSDDGSVSVVLWSSGDIEAYSNTGTILWSHNVPDAWVISMTPDGNKIAVGSMIDGANSEISLFESGTLKWAMWTYGGIYDVKISGDGTKIYAGTGERSIIPLVPDYKVYCFSSAGLKLWSWQFTSAILSVDTPFDGSIVIAGSDYGMTIALDVNGNELWFIDGGWFDPTISDVGGIITHSTFTDILVFNQSGYLLWKNDSYDSSFFGSNSFASNSGGMIVHPYGWEPGPYGIIIRDDAGNCLYHYLNESQRTAYQVAMSPDGKYIAAGSGNQLLLLSMNPEDVNIGDSGGDSFLIPWFEISIILVALLLAFTLVIKLKRK